MGEKSTPVFVIAALVLAAIAFAVLMLDHRP
jgi:hypothetical protein